MINWGTVPAGSVLPFHFASYDGATGASEAISGLAVTDIEVYKGTTVTQRASDAGYALIDTDGIDIDSMVGANGFSIDTGDNTDAGFYTVGSFFTVWVSSITADGQTVNFIAGTFRLCAAETSSGTPKADVSHWLGTAAATPTVAGVPEVDVTHWLGTAVATPTVAGVPEVDVTHLGGDAQSGTDLKDFADAGYDPATNKVQGVVLVDTLTTYTGNTPQTGDSFARLGAPAGASVSADLADIEGKVDDLETRLGTPVDLGGGATIAQNLSDIEAQTDDIGAAGAGLTALATQASVNTIDDFLDTEIAAIKAKTDQLTFTVANQVDANAVAISGDSTAADRLEALMDGLIVAQVNGVATTTSIPADGFTEATNDHFNGRLVTFLTGALTGQQTAIEDYVGATQTFTVTALTEAPADNDFFVIH